MKRVLGILGLACMLSHVALATTRTSNVITGNWSTPASWVGSTLPVAGDTVYIANGANITLDAAISVTAIRINAGGTLNLGAQTLSLTGVGDSIGNVLIYGTLNLNTGTINLSGQWINYGVFNCGTGTVNFDGGFEQSIDGTSLSTFYHFYNNNPNTTGTNGVTCHPTSITIKGNFIQNGQFHRNSNGHPDATVYFDGNTTLSGAYSFFLNHIVINAGATLNAGSKTIYLYGNWTNNGTFNCGTGTLWVAQDSYSSAQPDNQYLYQPAAQPFYNLYINKTTGSVKPGTYAANASGDQTVLNNFTLNRGTWNVNGSKLLTVAGNFTVNSSNGGVFTASTGKVILNGASAVTRQTLSPGTSALYDLQINNTGMGVILGSDTRVNNSLQLSDGMLTTLNGASFFELYLANSSVASLLAGYSSSNFILGKFRRELISGAGNYVFPIGPVNMPSDRYRPVTLAQTSANGATNILMYEDSITAASYKANWWLYAQPTGGDPLGTIVNTYSFATDFPAGTSECAISLMRGSVPPPAAWATALYTTTGATSSSITTTCPGVFSPFAFILGEPVPTTLGDADCLGATSTLQATLPSGSGSIRWYNAASSGTLMYTGANYTTPILSGTTSYYATHVNAFTGCETHRTIATATIHPLPVPDVISNTGICSGNSIPIGGTAVAGHSYIWWSDPVGFSSSSANPSVNPLIPTTYYLTETIDATGCQATTQVSISIDPLPVAPTAAFVDRTNFCSDDAGNITLYISGGSGSTLNWYEGACQSGAASSGNNLILPSPTSTTTFYAAWENGCGISACQSISVTVLPSPTAEAGPAQSICAGDTATLSGSGGGLYHWSSGDNTAIAHVSPSSSTQYNLTVTATNGCMDYDSLLVTVFDLPLALAGPDTSICPGETVLITASGGNTYDWDNGASTSSISVSPSASSLYSVTVTDANSCSATADALITVLIPIEISVSSNPSGILLSGQLVTFTVDPDSLLQYSFFINGVEMQSSSSNTYTTNDLQPGDELTVQVETAQCPVADKILNPLVIGVYNAFTPNGDNNNDLYLPGVDLTIINRWGQELYHGNEGWDGTYGGAEVSQGTYFYIIRLEDEAGEVNELKGSVTLIR